MVYLLLDSMAFGQDSLVRLNWFLVSVIGQNQWTEVSVLTLQFSTFPRHSTVFLTVVCLVNSANMVYVVVCKTGIANFCLTGIRVVVNGTVRSHPGSLFYQALPKVPFWVRYSFLIYINDIVLGIDSEIHLFADECTVYRYFWRRFSRFLVPR